MILDDMVGMEIEGSSLGNEAQWLQRMPPELEWDESEEALIVEGIVGDFGMRGYT